MLRKLWEIQGSITPNRVHFHLVNKSPTVIFMMDHHCPICTTLPGIATSAPPTLWHLRLDIRQMCRAHHHRMCGSHHSKTVFLPRLTFVYHSLPVATYWKVSYKILTRCVVHIYIQHNFMLVSSILQLHMIISCSFFLVQYQVGFGHFSYSFCPLI